MTPGQRANIKKIKSGRYYKQLIELGLTPGTRQWKTGHERLRLSERHKNSTRTERDKVNEDKRKRYQKNLEENRKITRERKARERAVRSDAINDAQRRRYSAARELEARKQCARRHVREPHRAIRSATNLYCKGLLTYEQYSERINDSISRAERLTPEESGSIQNGRGKGTKAS